MDRGTRTGVTVSTIHHTSSSKLLERHLDLHGVTVRVGNQMKLFVGKKDLWCVYGVDMDTFLAKNGSVHVVLVWKSSMYLVEAKHGIFPGNPFGGCLGCKMVWVPFARRLDSASADSKKT